jgi:hypothetical protein
MLDSIIWIAVLISSHVAAPAEVTHIQSAFFTEQECEEYLFESFSEDGWGVIDKNFSGKMVNWKDDHSGTLATYVCLEVHLE